MPAARRRVECHSLAADELAAYESFARTYFGPGSYRESLTWLYREHPLGAAPDDVQVAVCEGEVVGCLHRLRLPWRRDGEPLVLPSYHNLMVAEEHRHGVGLSLLLRFLGQDRFALLAGANEAADALYHKLGLAPLPLWWHRKLLSPPRVVMQLARTRLTHRLAPPRLHREGWAQADRRFEVLALDDRGELPERLAEALALPPQAAFAIAWDPDFYRWRFFHPLAPRHVTVVARQGAEPVGRVTAALVRQRGWWSGHVVDLAWRTADDRRSLLPALGRVLQRSGVHAMHLITGHAEAAEELVQNGWQRLEGCAGARFYAQQKAYDCLPGGLWSGQWDGGLPPGAASAGLDG